MYLLIDAAKIEYIISSFTYNQLIFPKQPKCIETFKKLLVVEHEDTSINFNVNVCHCPSNQLN
jgi:hypothetical protein